MKSTVPQSEIRAPQPDKIGEIPKLQETKPANVKGVFTEEQHRTEGMARGINSAFSTLEEDAPPVSLSKEKAALAELRQELGELTEATSQAIDTSDTQGIKADITPVDVRPTTVQQEKDKKPVRLGFKRKDISGFVQKIRGKQNVKYETPEGEKIFAKYASRQEGYRDTIAGLQREKRILDKLSQTGTVPKVGDLKIYPQGYRARLLMGQVDGNSLDSDFMKEEGGYARQHPQELILSTAQAHRKVLDMGVAVVDVNAGTYLIQQNQDGLSTNLVDFELACDLDNSSPDELQGSFNWYRTKDFGLRITRIDSVTAADIDILRQSDIHLWAEITAEWLLGPSAFWGDVPVSPEKQAQFQTATETVKPIVENETIDRAKKDYQDMIARGQEWKGGEQNYIDYELQHSAPHKMMEALIGVTFEDRLKAKGIQLPQPTVDFISKALSYDIRERPASFDALLSQTSIASGSNSHFEQSEGITQGLEEKMLNIPQGMIPELTDLSIKHA